MKIGSSVALIIIGAILALAVQDMIAGVDLTMIGYIFIAGGVLGLIFALATHDSSRGMKPLSRSSETRSLTDPNTGETVRRTEVQED